MRCKVGLGRWRPRLGDRRLFFDQTIANVDNAASIQNIAPFEKACLLSGAALPVEEDDAAAEVRVAW